MLCTGICVQVLMYLRALTALSQGPVVAWNEGLL